MRVGVLGGTFDPVHLGHLRAAEEVGEDLGLDRVYLIPAAMPPHKDRKPVTSFEHRLEMIRLATEGAPMLKPLDLEGRRQGLSYSIETLRELHSMFPSGLELFFIIGMDAFLEITAWKEHERLFDYSHFIVIQRAGTQEGRFEEFVQSLGMGFKREESGRTFLHPSGMRVFYKKITLMGISATQIREKISRGGSIRYLTPKAVRTYIMEKGLYGAHEIAG